MAAPRPRSRAHKRSRRDDIATNEQIGSNGAALIPVDAAVLTHCNTGSLACVGYGTALGVIRAAAEAGRGPRVWANETRPLLQGARLTMWELDRLGIDATLVLDGAGAALMARGLVDLVIVGADRIAANGDTANKIGTYSLAVAARHHGVPFYVAAPTSTVDLATPTGAAITIEERDPGEVTHLGGNGDRAGGRRRVQPRVRRHARSSDHRDRHRGRHCPAAARRSAPGHECPTRLVASHA